jgi:hypothetical protein
MVFTQLSSLREERLPFAMAREMKGPLGVLPLAASRRGHMGHCRLRGTARIYRSMT